MATLIYIHGFLSSPQSVKAELTARWLAEHAPDIDYRCPYLCPYPLETQHQLRELMAELEGEPDIGFVGSSLGGFWSTWLVEHFGHRAVLINPSVRPFELVHRVCGVPQHNFHTDDVYTMTEVHAGQFRDAYCQPLRDLSRYWLLAQTGDETLDYREAEARYAGCRQTIEEGGDHGFQGFERFLPDIVQFLFPGRS
ncbi:YqiA/YcfP family alpha/beta fold hydrolase [Pseudomaricurvus sp. HS19]|uniref:YqiA/YcfP family alpha/beta fold hydrolase n=1 Tax=Pseudomaricurvus sp. HS19 TaxID=2692626 RepID=UPI001367D54F|nr:YqiA/YcfP family alpha/beta fold hydrolase [Pseudomaricurvus sp. HS19]MYM63378.1 esterase YqiA [Pseudomaricurvus sp. HS19]